MGVVLIAKPGGTTTGVGRYVHMLHTGVQVAGVASERIAPTVPPFPVSIYGQLKRCGIDLHAFLLNFPVWAKYPSAQAYHFTSQNLASLLCFGRPQGRVIVTVHDIIPYILRNDEQLCSYRTMADRWFDRLAMWGLRRADHLIADSDYTKQALIAHLHIAPSKIDVVYLGIDHERFKPLAVPASLRERYNLAADRRYLIYVGSEDPRKNIATLIEALAVLRRDLPNVELIKVGRAHWNEQRQRLVQFAGDLGVSSAVHWLDDVPEADLPLLYNLADVCVMPSLYEGFGFPVLEAMACGTPVVAAHAASLPELVGDAGMLVDEPQHASAFTTAILDVLANEDVARSLCTSGLVRAAEFRWERTVAQTRTVYSEVGNLFEA